MHPNVKEIHDIQALRLENAKLRELCRLYAMAIDTDGCGWCPYYEDDGCDTETVPMSDRCRLCREMRGLGVLDD